MQWFDSKNKNKTTKNPYIRIDIKENLLNNEIKGIIKCFQNAFQVLCFPTHFPKVFPSVSFLAKNLPN